MPTLEILGLLGLAAGFLAWCDILRARETGITAARAACAAEGLQLLDDTVAITSIWPSRDENGRLRLRRVYRFEYSDTGNNRREGAITLLGEQVIALSLGLREV